MSSLWGHLVTSCNAEFLQHLKDRGISSVNCNIDNLNILIVRFKKEFDEIEEKINRIQYQITESILLGKSDDIINDLRVDVEFLNVYLSLKISNINTIEALLS